jgi:uncharacterized protein
MKSLGPITAVSAAWTIHCRSAARPRINRAVCFLLSAFCFLLLPLTARSLRAAEASIPDTSVSPFARVHPVGLDEVRWTGGFWADRFALCRDQTLPGLWSVMAGTNHSQFYQNFRIAAGLAEGRPRGAPFNDGDFYKWMEGACAVLAVTNDAALEARLDEIIAVIARAQRADGYLHTPMLIRAGNGDTNAVAFQDRNHFEMYNMGHLMTTACLHHRVTGKTNLLSVARKAADFLCQTFDGASPNIARSSVCPSHYMGMVELYRTTREPRYLELARKFFALRALVTEGSDDNQDRIPFDQQTNAVGHAVRANYLYAGAADLFMETGDASLWQPLEPIWRNLTGQKMYLTGACGALYDGAAPYGAKDQTSITRTHQAYGHNYELPNTTAHGETCANIGNVLWNWRMFLATGEARFVDVVELTLYNSVLSGVSLDGTNFFYTNPLRVIDPLPTELRWPRQRVPFLSSFCCPPNLARTVAEAAGYAYSKSQDNLWINLYGSSRLTTRLPAGQTLKLNQQTDYPWNGRVRLTLLECGEQPFVLKLRIPGWTKSATVRLNGLRVEGSPVPGSYFPVRRAWQAGDFLDLDLPMPVNVVEANPFVEQALNQLAVKRGPLVYCLESVDLPPGARILDVLLPDNVDLIARYDGHLLGGVVALDGKGLARPADAWTGELYRQFRPSPPAQVNLRFIPYYAWGNRGVSEMAVWLPREHRSEDENRPHPRK